jgi:hypothetical protein
MSFKKIFDYAILFKIRLELFMIIIIVILNYYIGNEYFVIFLIDKFVFAGIKYIYIYIFIYFLLIHIQNKRNIISCFFLLIIALQIMIPFYLLKNLNFNNNGMFFFSK